MFRKSIALTFALYLPLACVLAQQAPPQEPPKQSAASAPPASTFAENTRKSVGFLTVTYLKNNRIEQISGTCFFAFYEEKRLGDNSGFIYLVTNRHMAIPGIENGVSYPVQKATVRLNLRTPGDGMASEQETIPVAGGLHWVLPTDDAVDLAVLPGAPDRGKYDYLSIPLSMFATKEEITAQQIDAGDNVFFAGFFYQFPGQKKIQPIVREGMLAMMPDEEMETTLHRPGYLYLADVHAFHGNSGSPLFVNVGGFRNGNLSGSTYRLLGIVSGYYQEDSDFKLTVATTIEGTVRANSGIALVVPAYELKKVLDSPILQGARDAFVQYEKTKKGQ